eukprot:snap_masked-scaffold_83-processed-gene-0.23-mRNA-1 protein AED:1.00 eAED:1.00 QI:0/0/0/0/1/1/2/0/109
MEKEEIIVYGIPEKIYAWGIERSSTREYILIILVVLNAALCFITLAFSVNKDKDADEKPDDTYCVYRLPTSAEEKTNHKHNLDLVKDLRSNKIGFRVRYKLNKLPFIIH